MATLDKIKDALSETAQDVRDRALQVRDAVVDTAKGARDKAYDMADQARASGEKVREMIAGEPDALGVLKRDHEMVNSMFEQLEALEGQAETREGIFAQLKYELSTHAMVEEKLFYPMLNEARRAKKGEEAQDLARAEVEERKELIDEAYAEHTLVKQLLAELAAMPMGTPAWAAKLTVLKENVQHHVEEEEGELFGIAREVLDGEQLMKLGAQLQQEKLALAEAGKPDEEDEAEALKGNSAQKGRARSGAQKSQRLH